MNIVLFGIGGLENRWIWAGNYGRGIGKGKVG